MKQNQYLFLLFALIVLTGCGGTQKKLTEYVNPFLGTATLWEPEDLGYTRKIKSRTWGAETYPGATLPNAMVQLSPVTQFRSGAGYQYEDTVIYGFSHTAKGHWNLLHVPMLPVGILITLERIIVNLLNLPITDIIIRTADVYQ